ncbi:MAG: glycosyltransferase family 4 protein [Planctomycetota bacterium]
MPQPDQAEHPLRVTFVMKRPGMEGGVRVAAIYAEALARAGHEVHVVCTRKAVRGRRARLTHLLKTGSLNPVTAPIPSHLDPLPTLNGLPGKPITVTHLPTAGPITEQHLPDADVVVATWWETAEWVAALPSRKGQPLYLIQHDERVFPGQESQDRQERIAATWRAIPNRVVVAQWLADLLDQHGASPNHVIENAVNQDRFHAPPRDKQDRPTVGFMYSPVGFKGVDRIKAALELAAPRVPNLLVRAFGHGDPKLEGPGLPHGVDAEYAQDPDRDTLRAFYASCDAWLFASRCEGFGLPLLEAMACRTPVIATPAGAAPQLIDERVGRLLPDATTPAEETALIHAMADAIVDLTAQSPENWQATSENAYAVARQHRWDRAAERFEAVVRQAGGQTDADDRPRAKPAA